MADTYLVPFEVPNEGILLLLVFGLHELQDSSKVLPMLHGGAAALIVVDSTPTTTHAQCCTLCLPKTQFPECQTEFLLHDCVIPRTGVHRYIPIGTHTPVA